MRRTPWGWILGGAAALGALAYATMAGATPGARAKVGSFVQIPLASLGPNAVPAIPMGVQYVYMRVETVGTDTLDGPLVAYSTTPDVRTATQLGVPIPIRVPKSAVTSVS